VEKPMTKIFFLRSKPEGLEKYFWRGFFPNVALSLLRQLY
jgi:hypothetical protein